MSWVSKSESKATRPDKNTGKRGIIVDPAAMNDEW